MMRGKPMMFIDQYGHRYWARTVKELRQEVGGGRVSSMYIDKKDGRTVRAGYVIGQHWLTAYQPVELPV